jgi:hypothetical protein
MNNCKELFSSPQVLRTQIYEAIMQKLNLWDDLLPLPATYREQNAIKQRD